MSNLAHCSKPCDECPFRRDVAPGKFTAERYESLKSTVGRAGHEIGIGGPVFACHKTVEGRDRACAGWLAVCGLDHIGMRVAAARGEIPSHVFRVGADWPELFDSYEEMAEIQGSVS